MMNYIKFYGAMIFGSVINYSAMNELLQLIIVILSIIYGIIKIIKSPKE